MAPTIDPGFAENIAGRGGDNPERRVQLIDGVFHAMTGLEDAVHSFGEALIVELEFHPEDERTRLADSTAAKKRIAPAYDEYINATAAAGTFLETARKP